MLGGSLVLGAQGIADIVVTMSDRRAQLGGVVRDAPVTPVGTEARVIIFPQEASARIHQAFYPEHQRVHQALVDEGGRFQQTVPAGEYYVAAIAGRIPEHWMSQEWLAQLVPGAVAVAVALGETRNTTLRALPAPSGYQ
jgi:hypothetical protein